MTPPLSAHANSKKETSDDALPETTLPAYPTFLPSELSDLALANRHVMADLLNNAAWKSLSKNMLRRLRLQGKLKLGGKFAYLQSDENWEAFIRNLESTDWVAYIQPPPSPDSRANAVVNYLTRYLTGGPISDHRIVAADENEVTFLAREGKQVGGERQQVPITLTLTEFVLRWCLHIQPLQLTRTRNLGGWSNSCRGDYMACCRLLLEPIHPDEEDQSQESTDEFSREGSESLTCSHCGSKHLVLIEETPKPSWREILRPRSESCPAWYSRWQLEDDRRFWDGRIGEGFSDWYSQTVVESAKEPTPSPPVQLLLPGISPRPCYHLECH